MRKERTALRFLVLLVCVQIIGESTTSSQTIEVFRLARGVVYTYDFYEYSYYWTFSSWSSARDSGSVQYVVADSIIVADTLVAWSVLQRRDVFRRAYGSGLPDTSYFVCDSMLFTLGESRAGQHFLSGGLGVWAFPIGQASRVFRYSDSSRVQLSWRGIGPCHVIPGTYDTLSMSADSSLWRRHYGICNDWDDYGNLFQRRARLRSLVIVSVPDISPLPKVARLEQNYPNPFNPTTTIKYTLSSQERGGVRSHVSLKVFDLLSREVATLVNDDKSPGTYTITWDAKDIPAGVYFYRFITNGFVQTRKALLLK